jgi:hypothetical protein
LLPEVVVEKFEEGALVLYSDKYYLMELNNTAFRILSLADGEKNVGEVAKIIAKDYQISEDVALNDVIELYSQLLNRKIVEIVNSDGKSRVSVKEDSYKYIKNPDVILQEENPEGGILFNPYTKQVKILNATGLFIWKKCDGTLSLKEIVNAVQKAFKEASADEVAKDVQDFVEEMIKCGFIRTIETSSGEAGK